MRETSSEFASKARAQQVVCGVRVFVHDKRFFEAAGHGADFKRIGRDHGAVFSGASNVVYCAATPALRERLCGDDLVPRLKANAIPIPVPEKGGRDVSYWPFTSVAGVQRIRSRSEA
jgi:hypothetical protein